MFLKIQIIWVPGQVSRFSDYAPHVKKSNDVSVI